MTGGKETSALSGATNSSERAPNGGKPVWKRRPSNVFRWVLAHLSRETSSGRFLPEMDGLRFVASVMVVLFHVNAYLIAKAASPQYVLAAKSDWLERTALVGFRGVEMFFVISGFILALPFAAHCLTGAPSVSLRQYYFRRLTRIEPPYFVTLFLLFVLAIAVQGKNFVAMLPHLGANLFYLHSLIYGAQSPIIGVAWSLEIEVQFYLLVPLLTLVFAVKTRWSRRVLLVATIVTVIIAQRFYLPSHPRLDLSVLAYLQFFLVGFLLADIFLSDWKGLPKQRALWDVVTLIMWPLTFFVLQSQSLMHWFFPWFILLLYCAAFLGTWTNRFLSLSWATAIGGMCYSIYLTHYEVVSAVGRFTRPITEGWPYWLHLLIQFGLIALNVVVVCGLYFVILEKPCMRRDWPQRLWNAVRTKLKRPIDEVA